MTMKKRNILIAAAVVAGMAGLLLGLGAWQYYRYAVCNFTAHDGEGHGYYIYPDTPLDSVLAQIATDYCVHSPWSWRMHCRREGLVTPKPGYYTLAANEGNRRVIRRLQHGEQTPVRVTWNNQVRTREQLAARLSKQLMMDSVDIITRLDSDAYMQAFGLDKESSTCLFLPNTYEVYWTLTPDQLFARMNKEYSRFWTDERRAKAASLGLTPVQVQVIASIVESESNKTQEFGEIASVYLNRVRLGMPLQACPTVIFAWQDFTIRRVHHEHLQIDSPYNTYKYKGIPPGQIRCAKGTTIDMVLNAPKTNYLFMCANPDWSGTHLFSATYGAHRQTAKAYRKQLNERKIE